MLRAQKMTRCCSGFIQDTTSKPTGTYQDNAQEPGQMGTNHYGTGWDEGTLSPQGDITVYIDCEKSASPLSTFWDKEIVQSRFPRPRIRNLSR